MKSKRRKWCHQTVCSTKPIKFTTQNNNYNYNVVKNTQIYRYCMKQLVVNGN